VALLRDLVGECELDNASFVKTFDLAPRSSARRSSPRSISCFASSRRDHFCQYAKGRDVWCEFVAGAPLSNALLVAAQTAEAGDKAELYPSLPNAAVGAVN
jgi:hypothetical protein